MSIRFIHTADWQIGKPFANFPSELAGELAAARLNVIARIAAAAHARDATHVLVAGDIFDAPNVETLLVRRTLEHLRRESQVAWVLLPGNHDPVRRDGIWDRARAIGLPENVVVLTEPAPFALSPHASVLPAPLTSNMPGRDPTEWFDAVPVTAGHVRIGLAHGSITGFSSDGESNVTIAPGRAARAKLDYLALGDWHGATRIDKRTWYAGTPEPDRYPANTPGYVLAVTAHAGAEPVVEQVHVAHFTWARHEAVLASSDDIWTLAREIEGLVPVPAASLVRVKLSGSLTIADEGALQSWAEEAAGRLRHLELDMQALQVRATASDLDRLAATGALREAAEKLSGLAQGETPQASAARRALQKLFAYAAAEKREDA